MINYDFIKPVGFKTQIKFVFNIKNKSFLFDNKEIKTIEKRAKVFLLNNGIKEIVNKIGIKKHRFNVRLNKAKNILIASITGCLNLISSDAQQRLESMCSIADSRNLAQDFSIDDTQYVLDGTYLEIWSCCSNKDKELIFKPDDKKIEIKIYDFFESNENKKVSILEEILIKTYGQNYKNTILNDFKNIVCKPKTIHDWDGVAINLESQTHETVLIIAR